MTIDSYTVNGIVKLNGMNFWRIDDLDSGRTGLDFVQKPAALILADAPDTFRGRDLAEAVCKALNEHRTAQRAKDQNAIDP